MKVLVTGRAIPHNPNGSTGEQLAEGFRQAGHECVFYGCYYGYPLNFIGYQEVQTQHFDLVIVTEMNDGMPGYEPLFSYHRLRDVPRFYWDFDVSYHPDLSLKRAKTIPYNGYFVANRYFLGEFEKLGSVLHLPYACSPQIHHRKRNIRKEHPLGFVGSITSEREILKNYAYCTEGVYGEALIDEINKIFVMVHINQQACKGLVPGRPWETAGCGTCLLMDRVAFDDFKPFIPEQFIGTAVNVFENLDNMDYYKDKYSKEQYKDKAVDDGMSLMAYVHRYHSYKQRAEEILGWIKT